MVYVFQGGSDAASPIGGLTKDGKAHFGTTYYGGASNLGTVYKLAGDGTETVLYSFAEGSDGANPEAGLIADAKGNLYGTTYSGGAAGPRHRVQDHAEGPRDGTLFLLSQLSSLQRRLRSRAPA